MEKQKNIPQLRFPEFYGEWERNKIGKLFNISAGGDIPKENVNTIKDDIFKYPIYANAEKDKGLYAYSNIYRVGKEVVTIAGRGVNMGIAHSRKEKFYPIVRLLVLEPKNKSSVEFFEYAFNRINFYVESTGVPQLTAPQVSSYLISYPTFPEQQKIASFFTAIDKKISQLKQKLTLLEQYKKGVMQKIFSQEIRFKPALSSAEADDNGQEFPKWEKKKLGEVATFSKGKGISISDTSTDGSTECIRYGELYTYYSETINEVKSRTNVNSDKLVLSEANDVIIPASGETQIDIATASCVLRSGIALGGDLNIIKSTNNGVFLSYYLNNQKKRDIANLAQGISVVHLYASQLSSLELDIPTLPEQTKIASFLSAIDDKINHTRKQIEKAEVWKKGLMQQMFV